MPKISVIIPVYNVEKYLRECIDSIVNQTFKDIEIICINDGSVDSSLQILNEYAAKDKRIIVIDQKNSGAGAARNVGLRRAVGKYIIFFDSDDYMDACMLEHMYNTAEVNNASITICRSKTLFDDTKRIELNKWSLVSEFIGNNERFEPLKYADKIFQFCVGWPWDKLYLREFVEKNKLFFQNLRQSNDTFFVLYSLVCAEIISICDESLVVHRKHSGSLESTRIIAPQCFYCALKKLYKQMRKHNKYKNYEKSFVNYCLTFSMWHIETMQDEMARDIMIKHYIKILKLIGFLKFSKDYFYDCTNYLKTKSMYKERKNILDDVFCVERTEDHKVITILGFKIKIRIKK